MSNASVPDWGTVRIGDLVNLPDWITGLAGIAGRRAMANVWRRAERMVSAAEPPEDRDGPSTITSALLAQRATPERPEGLSMGQIRDNVATLLGAGTDTTASALTWAIILLAASPDARARVEEEARRSGADHPGETERLPWARAVVQESMRLFPPAPVIGRIALEDDGLADVEIRGGTEIYIAPWVVHRHRTLWRDPDSFRPERFLEENQSEVPRYGFLPFSAGPRICIGAQFAMQEMTLILSRLCASLRFEMIEGETLKLRQFITLQPAGRFRMSARAIQD